MMLTGPSGRTVGVAASNVQQVDQAVTAWTRAGTTILGTTLNGTLSDTSTTITAFSGVAGVTYHVRCLGAGQITHHGTNLIITQTGATIAATAAGDTFDVEMITASTCRLKNYQRATGKALVETVGLGANTFTGAQTIPNVVMASPGSDHTSVGPTSSVYAAGEAITIMDLVILNGSAQWVKTDANASATFSGMLAIALETQGAGSATNVALPGSKVRDDTWNWTPGATLYLSEDAGAITATAPTTAGSAARIVGFALSADVVWFLPSATYTAN